MDQVYSFICSLSDASRKRSRSPTESGSNTATSSTPCAHPYLRLQVLETATLFDVAMLLFEHHPALRQKREADRHRHHGMDRGSPALLPPFLSVLFALSLRASPRSCVRRTRRRPCRRRPRRRRPPRRSPWPLAARQRLRQ